MHSASPIFKEIEDRINHLSIKELNEDKFLQESSIQVLSIRSACLIIDTRITGENVDLPLSMERLVECLLRRSNAFQVLCDKNVNELNIFGYYYEPCDYLDATGTWLSMFKYRCLFTLCSKFLFQSKLNFYVQNCNYLIKHKELISAKYNQKQP